MAYAETELAWKTQAGHRHQVEGLENEDAVFVTRQHPLFEAVLMVADGMGGHPRPKEASEIAVRVAREMLFDPERLQRSGGITQALTAAQQAAHQAVQKLHSGRGKPPGTTLSIAVIAEATLYIGHVGDGSVLLMRGGNVSSVAGGEERRAGNRPAQFLGQESALEPEFARISLAEDDRILLCTDGLTRYFNEAGAEALERVLGRQNVEIQVIASQLTAHSRPDEYDDDTTVALAEVTEIRHGARPVPKRPTQPVQEDDPEEEESMADTRRGGASAGGLMLGALVGAALLAGGFMAGRLTAPTATTAPNASPSIGSQAKPVADTSKLPGGNLILLDQLGRRVYSLPTRGGVPANQPVDLQAYRVGSTGQFVAAGRFHLDPNKGELTDPDGNSYPVDLDYSRGALRILKGGQLSITSHASGARVFVDGREIGAAPLKLSVAVGRHQVRVEGSRWVREGAVDMPDGGSVTWSVGP